MAGGFWEAPPSEWSEAQLRQMFADSPWAQDATVSGRSTGSRTVPVYLASARPMREAEAELRRRTKAREDILFDEYRAWLDENAATHVVLAVKTPRPELLADAAESRRIETESRLHAAGSERRPAIVFPPTNTDPWLRLAFARPPRDRVKQLVFDLYVPGADTPYRQAIFESKELMYKGAIEY